MPPPSPHEQIEFLARIQRILREGKFTATYKYSLLRALADLSVEMGDDSGEGLAIPTRLIAEKVIHYYWNQANPYPAKNEGVSVLLQNRTGQAEVITAIIRVKARVGGSLPQVRQSKRAWAGLVSDVDSKIREMPIPRLQEMAGGMETFLYPQTETPAPGGLVLNPGVAYCFRRFHGLIIGLLEGEWARWIQQHRRNIEILGQSFDLHAFLFGDERQNLKDLREFFRDLSDAHCFFCQSRVRGEGALDHFVPWSRYPVDMMHNFVFAHPSCNQDKREMLASEVHLGNWRERNEASGEEIAHEGTARGVIADLAVSKMVAEWAYEQAARNRERVWVSVDESPRLLEPYWRRFLPHAPELAAD